MVGLEAKAINAKKEVTVTNALNKIQLQNARLERSAQETQAIAMTDSAQTMRLHEEDTAAAKRAFSIHTKTTQEPLNVPLVTYTPFYRPKPKIQQLRY